MRIERFAALSLNPALDVTLRVENLAQEYNNVLHEQSEAAGKAVNVARVLHSYGTACRTLVLAGTDNLHKYRARLERDGVQCEFVETEGEIRENISVVQADDSLFRLARPGFVVTEEKLEQVRARLVPMVGPGTLLIAAGRNPRGVSGAQFCSVCDTVRGLGGALAVDTCSLTEQEIFALRPWLMKPNIEELEQMTGETLRTRERVLAAAERYRKNGVENLLISMGPDGALFCGEGGVFYARVPRVHVKSTVGAGDSTLSGFVMAYAAGRPIADCVRIAASFGTASVMLDGTNPPLESDLRVVYPQVEIETL